MILIFFSFGRIHIFRIQLIFHSPNMTVILFFLFLTENYVYDSSVFCYVPRARILSLQNICGLIYTLYKLHGYFMNNSRIIYETFSCILYKFRLCFLHMKIYIVKNYIQEFPINDRKDFFFFTFIIYLFYNKL